MIMYSKQSTAIYEAIKQEDYEFIFSECPFSLKEKKTSLTVSRVSNI